MGWRPLFRPRQKRVQPKYTLTEKLWTYLQNYAEKHRAKGNGFGFGLVGPKDVTRTLSARYYKDGSEILVYQGKRKNPRRLTPRECARLMGFPDTFRIPVSDTRAYKQFSEAAVVPMIAAVAKLMAPSLPSRERQYGCCRDSAERHGEFWPLDQRTTQAGIPLVLPTSLWSNSWKKSGNYCTWQRSLGVHPMPLR